MASIYDYKGGVSSYSQKRFDISRRQGGTNYFTASIRNPKTGRTDVIGPYNDVQSLNYHIEQYCIKHMYEAGGEWGGKREGAGRKKGSTKAVVAERKARAAKLASRRNAYESFLTKEFGRIKATAIMVADAAAASSNAKITGKVAQDVLRRVVNSQGKYNIYSGNLSNAYHALIIQGRRVVKVVQRDQKTRGHRFEPQNGRLVVSMMRRRHKTKNRWTKRYVKPYEREEGYADVTSFGRGVINLGYMNSFTETQSKNRHDGRVQSGVIVENSAPYAGAVQAAGYQVAPNAIYRSYQGKIGSKYKSILYVETKNMLKAAGLI